MRGLERVKPVEKDARQMMHIWRGFIDGCEFKLAPALTLSHYTTTRLTNEEIVMSKLKWLRDAVQTMKPQSRIALAYLFCTFRALFELSLFIFLSLKGADCWFQKETESNTLFFHHLKQLNKTWLTYTTTHIWLILAPTRLVMRGFVICP